MVDAANIQIDEAHYELFWVNEVVGETECGQYLFRIVDQVGDDQGSATMDFIMDSEIQQVEFA